MTEPALVRRARPGFLAALFCLLFLAEGFIFIPYFGLENDETLFSMIIYPPPGALHTVRILGHFRFQTMLNSYLGTLKACLYQPLFWVFGTSTASVRIPVLLAGALTIWLLFILARQIAGTRAALAATALLAADASFVLTTCMDWGPVAIQHLLLLSGLLLLWRFHQSGRELLLAAGFFVFGLALWDKALFAWALIGLVAGGLVVFPRQLRSRLTRRNLAIAVVSLLIGAAPLVSFNVKRHMETFRDNARFSSEGIGQKATLLWTTAEGGSLFGYMVRNGPPLGPVRPGNRMEALSVQLSETFGQRQAGLLPYACILALALLPWLWHTPARKPMVFALIFVAVVWLQMAFTKDAGLGAHHTVLLWPFPHLFAGVGLAEASRKLGRAGLAWLVAGLVMVCGSGLVVLNQYLAQLAESGPTAVWTDAIDPLAACLRTSAASHVYLVDWGIVNPLRVLSGGKLPLDLAPEETPEGPDTQADTLKAIGMRDAVFVAHTEGNEVFLGANARMDALAQSAGYRPETLQTIADRHDRPIFRVYRYVEGR